MVNSITENQKFLLAKAIMVNAAANQKTQNADAKQGAAYNPIALENGEHDTFVRSGSATEETPAIDEVMKMLDAMSDEEINALMVEYGITEDVSNEEEIDPSQFQKSGLGDGQETAPSTDVPTATTPSTDAPTSNAPTTEVPEEVVDDAEVSETEAAVAASSLGATTLADGEESSKIKEEIEVLEEEKDANYTEMEKIEAAIETLTKKAEENIMKAAKVQEQKVQEHEEETQAAVEENINAYVQANKEGGEGMTREDLQNNIKTSLSNVPEVGDAISAAIEANAQITEIDSKLGELNSLIADTKEIEAEIEAKTQQYDACKEAEEAEAEAQKACDPIGFTMGEGAEQVQYDFIVDDGAFDSTSDFLGAENQWAEMAALDTDGDQVVSAAELEAGNIKAVKTDANGNQSVVSLAEEFGEDFSINLASYQEGGSHAAIDTTTDTDNDGTVDQELLGTFSMNVNGQEIKGYNTLDDTDWLAENYGLSTETAAEEVAKLGETSYSMELKQHVNFFNTYTQKVEDLKEELKATWVTLGQTEATLEALNGKATEEAVDQVEENAEVGNPAATDEAVEKEETETPAVDVPTAEELEEKELELEEENFFLAA